MFASSHVFNQMLQHLGKFSHLRILTAFKDLDHQKPPKTYIRPSTLGNVRTINWNDSSLRPMPPFGLPVKHHARVCRPAKRH